MLYGFSESYKRSVYFVYSKDENEKDYLCAMNSRTLNSGKPVIYDAEKFDKNMAEYDVLPAIGAKLVSKKFKEAFVDLENKEIEFIPAIIKNKRGEENSGYFCMNTLITLPLLDKKRSLYLPSQEDKDDIEIIQAFYLEKNMGKHMIARMEERLASVVVSEEFFQRTKKMNIKGLMLEAEGSTIYTEKGLREIKKKMKKIYGK